MDPVTAIAEPSLDELLDRAKVAESLSDDQLAKLVTDLRESALAVVENPASITDTDLAKIDDAVAAIERAEQLEAARGQRASEKIDLALSLQRKLRGDDTEPVRASSTYSPQRPVTTRSAMFAPRRRGPRAVIRAASGQQLGGEDAMVDVIRAGLNDASRTRDAMRHRIVTIESASDAAWLTSDEHENAGRIAAASAAHQRALRASGGICAPSPASYDLRVLSTTDRPVRDALVPFRVDRGGIRWIKPPTLSDVAGGTTVWTAATDITPGQSTKPRVAVSCGDVQQAFVNAISETLQVGNLRQAYFGEQVDAWLRQLHAAAARLAEQTLISAMASDSTVVTSNLVVGAARDVVSVMDRAASDYRNRQRMAADEILTAIMPAWLRDMCRVDLTRAQFTSPSDLKITNDDIDALFTARGVSPVWSPDMQAVGAQVDGYLNGWPSTANALVFHPATFAFLDGGALNVGVVRDSTLVGTNDFLMFFEVMENVAMFGVESLFLEMQVCADGSTSAAKTVSVCPEGS